jgi:hypothetical protein
MGLLNRDKLFSVSEAELSARENNSIHTRVIKVL